MSWRALTGEKIGSFDDLGVDIVIIWARDTNSKAGIIEIAVIAHREKKEFKILYGWTQPYSDDEQGFYWDENDKLIRLDKKGIIGRELEIKGERDKDGNPILILYIRNTQDNSETIIRTIDIKKFVENFKDEKSPPMK